MSIRNWWNRLETEVVDSAMRGGWQSRGPVVVFVRAWVGTLSVFAILCTYAAVLNVTGHDAAARTVGELAVLAGTFGIGAFIGAIMCEAEGRK